MSCRVCDEPATVSKTCDDMFCSGFDLQFCDRHKDALVDCPACGEPLLDAPAPVPAPVVVPEPHPMDEMEVVEVQPPLRLPTVDAMLKKCPLLAQVGDRLAVGIEACNGLQACELPLGHDFAAMRLAEAEIRQQNGVQVRGMTAKGANLALMELRLLLVADGCNPYEIAVAFADQRGCNLVMRSTAAATLVRKDEIDRLQNLVARNAATPADALVLAELRGRSEADMPLARCSAATTPYRGRKLFATCGAYSFFTPLSLETPLKELAAGYEAYHNDAYRHMMGVSTDNPQLWNHSEQTAFKMLAQNQFVVAEAIREARRSGLPSGRLKLRALAVDIFTTRRVCPNCMRATTRHARMDGGFFDMAIRAAAQEPEIVVEDVRKLVRYDCVAGFEGAWDADRWDETPVAPTTLVLHHGPADASPVPPPSRAVQITVTLNIRCNLSGNPLLSDGATETLRLAALTQLNSIAEIRDDIYERPERAAATVVRLTWPGLRAGRKLNFVAALIHIGAKMRNGMPGTVLREYARILRMDPDADREALRSIVAMYGAAKICFLADDPGMKRGLQAHDCNDRRELQAGIWSAYAVAGACFIGAPLSAGDAVFYLSRVATLLVRLQFEREDVYPEPAARDRLLPPLQGIVDDMLQELIDMDDSAADNFARVIAIWFDRLDQYRAKLA